MMGFEQIESIYSIVMTLAGLMVSLFKYVQKPRKIWIYTIIFFLSNMLSNYYWGVYMLVMEGEYPNVSSLLAYFGWNVALMIIPFLLLCIRSDEEKHFFSILALLPIPINLYQLKLYLTFGGVFNNVWQSFFATFGLCVSLNLIIFYIKNRGKNAKIPYISFAFLFYLITEYVMWTASCFDWPSEWLNPYNHASVLNETSYLVIPWAVIKTFVDSEDDETDEPKEQVNDLFKPIYVISVLFFCIGGYLLALWMRSTLMAGIGQVGETDPYSVIAVMLFVISFVIVAFTLAIILVINSIQKSEESKEFKAAKVIAEHSNAAKSEFLANMSHEIRTPINAVLGMNEMILNESLKAGNSLPEDRDQILKVFESINNYAGNIDSAGHNLLSIINDILDFSKVEAGKLEIVNVEYRLSSVLNDVSHMIDFKAKDKGLKFLIDAQDTMPDCLYGDEVRIRQIMTNLLNNAVKYTQEGYIQLSVSSKTKPETSGNKEIELIVSVKDTGIGIKEEDIVRLFDKFERVDMEKNSTVEGTGLGLAITRNLLEMMGGSIDVKSKYGKGSVFTAIIPQRIASDEPIGDFKAKSLRNLSFSKPEEENLKAPGAHILIVDDTQMNLVVAKGLLKNTEIRIDTAESGEEAIKCASLNSYDIILMDQRMPGMDGVEAMHKIREDRDGKNNHTPFICLTADAVSGARERYIAEGFDDYLTKPINSKTLRQAVFKYLQEDKKMSGSDGITKDTAAEEKLIDRNAAAQYYSGNDELYDSMLDAYILESETKAPLIDKYYKARDWKNYGAVVHALKSTSRMIGAMGLSEIAARMEAASNKKDEEAIYSEHEGMIELYKRVLDLIIKQQEERKAAANIDNDQNEEFILEFEPENGSVD